MTFEVATQPYFADFDPHIPENPDSDYIGPSVMESRARILETGIKQDPERFQFVLDLLGEISTSGSTDELIRLGIVDEDLEAATIILTYFSGNSDIGVICDSDTEKALTADTILQEARRTHSKATRKTYTIGPMKHDSRANQKADPAKNAVRRLILECYIARVIAWRQQHQDP
jgi:hypothetical protein